MIKTGKKSLFSTMLLFLVLVLFTLFLSACSKDENEIAAKEVMTNYFNQIKNNNSDEAYKLLDVSSLPNKEEFISSVNNSDLEKYKVLKTKKIDEKTYKLLTNITINGSSTEMVFLISNKSGSWKILLNSNSTQENLEF